MKSVIYFLILLLAVFGMVDSSFLIGELVCQAGDTASTQLESNDLDIDPDIAPLIALIQSANVLVTVENLTTARLFQLQANATYSISTSKATVVRPDEHQVLASSWKSPHRQISTIWLVSNPINYMINHCGILPQLYHTVENLRAPSKLRLGGFADEVTVEEITVEELEHFTAQAIYLDNSEKITIKTKEQLRNAKVLDSKAEVYADQGLYAEALRDLLKNLSIAEESDSPMQLMFVNRQLALLYMQLEDYIQAEKYLLRALELSKTKIYLKSDEYDILKIKLELNKKLGNEHEEFTILKRLNELRESIDYTDNGQNVINAITLKYQKGLYDERFRMNQTILEKEIFLNQLFRVIFVLVVLVLIFLIRSYRIKIKNKMKAFDRNILQLENDQWILEKNSTKGTAHRSPIFLQDEKPNRARGSIVVENRGKTGAPLAQPYSTRLDNLLKSHLMTEENWNEFKEVFVEEFPDFYNNIQTHYANLTAYNLRIIFLTKLELSNHEIANILGISYDAVKKAKQRLRKKVDKPSVEDFIKELNGQP